MQIARSMCALLMTLGLAVPALAAGGPAMNHGEGAHAHGAAAMSEGKVTKVNGPAGKITIKHGPLKNLNMPPMTMVFKAGAGEMLSQVKAGDSVRFVAEDVGGALTLTQLQVVR